MSVEPSVIDEIYPIVRRHFLDLKRFEARLIEESKKALKMGLTSRSCFDMIFNSMAQKAEGDGELAAEQKRELTATLVLLHRNMREMFTEK